MDHASITDLPTGADRATVSTLTPHPGDPGNNGDTISAAGRRVWSLQPALAMDHAALATPLVLERRLGLNPGVALAPEPLRLALTADERTRLRGLRQSTCARPLLLQLPRGDALEPGEWLAAADGTPRVQVQAAPEPLLVVTADTPLTLLQAAYHLGNRHVALELKRDELRLLEDSVLEQMLRQRGLTLTRDVAPFRPEAGAYSASAHQHSHGQGDSHHKAHGHSHGHPHDHDHPASHDAAPALTAPHRSPADGGPEPHQPGSQAE